VKSAGWEKRMAQLPSIHSWKCIGPCVVSALKSGTTFPRRRTCATGKSPRSRSQTKCFGSIHCPCEYAILKHD
jgi:hypothetical protein